MIISDERVTHNIKIEKQGMEQTSMFKYLNGTINTLVKAPQKMKLMKEYLKGENYKMQ